MIYDILIMTYPSTVSDLALLTKLNNSDTYDRVVHRRSGSINTLPNLLLAL